MANLATDFRVISVDASKTSIAEVLARRVEISSSSYSYPEEEVGMGYKRCDIACVISIGFVAFVRYRIYRMRYLAFVACDKCNHMRSHIAFVACMRALDKNLLDMTV